MKHESIKAADRDLQVDIIDGHAGFLRLRHAWQDLEQRDPEATVFLSWDWLAEAFRDNLYRWSVLVVRESSAPGKLVCILPLKYRVHWSTSRGEFQTELQAAGRLLWSEYTGFLCDPDHEKAALIALAHRLAQMPWVKFSMRYVGQHRRSKIFTDALAKRGFLVRFKEYLINNNKTNNLLSPQVTLPDNFDTYLSTQISRNKRQQFNRFRRRALNTGDYTITCTDAATFETDLDDLLTFWQDKWRDEKGPDQASRVARNYGDVLRAARRTGSLFMPVIRKGDVSLGALGHVLDPQRGIVHFIIAGRDSAAQEPFIGAALHFFSIEWAIRNGFGYYDFCHGNEAYKYGFGAQDKELLNVEIRRRELAPEMVFDSLCIGAALGRVDGFLTEGKVDQAAKACAQLSKVFT